MDRQVAQEILREINTPKLAMPTADIMRYWLLDLLNETNNGLAAHMTLYASNPGNWDRDSSWGALQTVVNVLAADFWTKIKPVPRLSRPTNVEYAMKVVADYVMLSEEMPLVKDGYVTKNSQETYARLLTKYIAVLLALHQNVLPPAKVYDKWKTNTFR